MADDLTVDSPIYRRIAVALAERCEADFACFDPAEVRSAMQRALASPTSRASFKHWLTGRVEALSNGTVTLELAEPRTSDQQGNGLLLRVVTLGEPFAEPVSITASETPVHWPMRSGS